MVLPSRILSLVYPAANTSAVVIAHHATGFVEWKSEAAGDGSGRLRLRQNRFSRGSLHSRHGQCGNGNPDEYSPDSSSDLPVYSSKNMSYFVLLDASNIKRHIRPRQGFEPK